MNTPPKLSFICPMPWTQMSGTERSRFCQKCGHHVRNLSLMSAGERAELQHRAQTERICGTYYVRLSGEMVTPDAPLTRSEWSRVKQFGVAALSAGAMALAAGCVSAPVKQSSTSLPVPITVVGEVNVPQEKIPAVACDKPTNQTPAIAEKKDDEEVIQLSGFYVSDPEDEGYRAADTLAGTRIKTSK